ncbi:MAG: FAD-dependent oxidoreductase [Castellaniella sp.]
MTTYDVTLTGKREVAEATMEFSLQKPADLTYRAGQFCDIQLPAREGAPQRDSLHGFSFVSAPFEPDLRVATRMRGSRFKEDFRKLPTGSTVQLLAAFGDFTLHRNVDIPAVFIIGGIGVTPVRSMIVQVLHEGTAHRLTLIHANRTPAQAPYKEEFRRLAQAHENFTFVPVYTDTKVAGVEHGRVDGELIRRHVTDLKTPRFYMSGPEGMVKAMRALLLELGVDEDNLRTEEFQGY